MGVCTGMYKSKPFFCQSPRDPCNFLSRKPRRCFNAPLSHSLSALVTLSFLLPQQNVDSIYLALVPHPLAPLGQLYIP